MSVSPSLTPTYTLQEHWVEQARKVPSPNFNARPDPDDIGLIVLHNISLPPGQFGGPHIEALFQNRLDHDAHPYFEGLRDLRVSAHFLIRRDGELVQFVACDQRAWHAGASSWRGRDNCNDYALGIELEGCDDQVFDERQYAALKPLLAALIRHYPRLSRDTITGHEHIAPGRKTDPGPCFDWARIGAW
ncbi:1,6-anhydro-N-acetylmuramyl-L-alanine amidase AmpD [Alloalcanivorax xenomutans]|uniref:1,6-anhydro-N-acetylmuramyl-L-alanine amidase AmpD n=1 Tax=Alloalcanivorax xenomutans TaxID=1094342 RepID=UPI0009EF6450|nr:1,6-anhydro-N-acetylmuramyl-L-alanine amidase AmpD [Alloalcanivorax xenomutans]WOA30527.1 1,6-anhydro-N-acetylmuramyl-L-alanine amidase AmpD [Alloalcanivorax xenomutans]